MPSSPSLADEALPLAPGEVLAEKYRIERVLGKGGMGFVVAARNIHLGKRVAIKMMLPAAMNAPLAVARFEREARAAVQLKSEHVAEVLDIGKLPTGEPYIVMELLEGSDFEALVSRERPLAVDEAVEYVLQVCEAVAEAHALGIVHRDLKPKNLFLSHRIDGTPVVKVLDFGISKWTATTDADSHSLTRTSDVFGSPNYMSPEQIRSARDVDGRTDIWSLGVILFELLTGRVPFVAETLPQLCALVLEVQPPAVSELRADVPDALVQVVARCLEKNPAWRFGSVRDLADALAPYGQRRALVSPSASTIPALPPSIALGLPLSSTTGGAAIRVSTASHVPQSRWRFALLAVPALVVGGTLWVGLHGWRPGPAASIAPDAAVAVLASPPPPAPIAPPPPIVTASAAVTASVTAAPVTAAPKPPVVVAPRGVDAGAKPPKPPPTTDELTPADRK